MFFEEFQPISTRNDRDGSDTDPGFLFLPLLAVSVFCSPRGEVERNSGYVSVRRVRVTAGEIASRRPRATMSDDEEGPKKRSGGGRVVVNGGFQPVIDSRPGEEKKKKGKVKRKENGGERLERRVPFSFDSSVALPLQLEIITLTER